MSRLNPGTVLAGIFAVLFASAGAYVVRSYLQVNEPEPEPSPVRAEVMQVPFASAELLPGRAITMGDIGVRQMQRDAVVQLIEEQKLPDNFMTNPEQIVGRILRKPVATDDTFTSDLFYPEGTGPTVADRLKPGFRAVTIDVTDTGLVAGFASPATLVDVLFRSDELENFPETTFTVVEGIEVLAVGRSSYPGSQADVDGEQEVHATLAVTPKQASVLRVLDGRGEMTLALRSPNERAAQTVQSELLEANSRLGILLKEANLLRKMKEFSGINGTEFTGQERLAAVAEEIKTAESEIEAREAELASSTAESRRLTLAEVLGVPDPPEPPEPQASVPPAEEPPPRMELYLGGQRTSLIFEPRRERAATAPTPSAAVPAQEPPSTRNSDRPDVTRPTASKENTTSQFTPDATLNRRGTVPGPVTNNSDHDSPDARTAASKAFKRLSSRSALETVAETAPQTSRDLSESRQAELMRTLRQLEQRVKDIQTAQVRQPVDTSTQPQSQRKHRTSGSDVPASIRTDTHRAEAAVEKPAGQVKALERGRQETETTPFEPAVKAEVRSSWNRQMEFSDTSASARITSSPGRQQLEAGSARVTTGESGRIRFSATRETRPGNTTSTRVFVWTPEKGSRRRQETGVAGGIEIFSGSQQTASQSDTQPGHSPQTSNSGA